MGAVVGGLQADRWFALWRALQVQPPADAFDLLSCLYSELHRSYHSAGHINACLDELTRLRHLAANPLSVELAVWFHDAIYQPLRHDNEQRSADLAGEVLITAGLHELAPQVRVLILATEHTGNHVADDTGLLIDIDLSVLGAPAEIYDAYANAVRREYCDVPDQQFATGRARVLERFLIRPFLYTHAECRAAWEHQARANLSRELALLAATGQVMRE